VPAVPIVTESAKGVPCSASQPKGPKTTELYVPIAEESSVGVPGPDNQTDGVKLLVGEETHSLLLFIGCHYLCVS